MKLEKKVKTLSTRVVEFLDVNKKVNINKLKFHLNCKSSHLLITLGILLNKEKITLTEKKGNIILSSR